MASLTVDLTVHTVAECHAALRRVNNLLSRAATPAEIEALWRESDEWLDRMLSAMDTEPACG